MPIEADPTVPWESDDADAFALFPPEDSTDPVSPALSSVPIRSVGDFDWTLAPVERPQALPFPRTAARAVRRRDMLAWSRLGRSRTILMVGVVLALIGATALRTALKGGSPDPAFESTLNESPSADRSTSPAESSPPSLGPASRTAGPPQNNGKPVAAAQAPLSSARAKASVRPAAKVTGPGRSASEPPFSGALKIVTEPAGANVFVNQQLVGTSPVLLRKLRAGSHVIRVEDAGYQPWSNAVRVPAGKQTLVSAKLQRDSSH